MTLVFGGVSFPVVAVGGKLPQPLTDKGLPYLQDALNHYLADAVATAMAGQLNGNPSRAACQETGIANPDWQASKLTVELPYLALWAENGRTSEGTMRWDNVETRYALEYVLPPLPFLTVQDVAVPLLQLVQKLLVLLIKNGGDPAHRSGARVWDEAGIVSIRLGDWQIECEPIGDDLRTSQAFPMLMAEVFVVEQEGYDPGGIELERADHTVAHNSEDGAFPNFVSTQFTPT